MHVGDGEMRPPISDEPHAAVETLPADEDETDSVASTDVEEKRPLRYATKQMRLDQIRVGKRFRKNPSTNVESLKRSIEESELLHLLVVTRDGLLVAGHRRLEALKELGETETLVRVVRNFGEGLLLAMRDENVEREPLTPLELAALADAIEPEIRAEAKERQRQGGRRKVVVNNHNLERRGRARDRVAAAVGKSASTLKKIKEVQASGRADLIEEMDRSGKVDPVHRRLKEPQRDLISELERKATRFIKETEPDIDKLLDDSHADGVRAVRLADRFEKIGRFAARLRDAFRPPRAALSPLWK
jgi:ParB-like nuclease domain.